MKGVVLCGGSGSRLFPLTKVINKALLPVYNKPMVYYPIETLVKSGIDDVLLVCGGNSVGDFLPLLENGEQFGLRHLHYTVQDKPRGIADALGLAEEFVGGDNMCVILADNIFQDTFSWAVSNFEGGAKIFLTTVAHPEHYGVVETDSDGKVISIEEKPKVPKSNLIATGLYIYDYDVWSFIKGLAPSARGELEITDVNNHYLKSGKLRSKVLNGLWADCGENYDGYFEAISKARLMQLN